MSFVHSRRKPDAESGQVRFSVFLSLPLTITSSDYFSVPSLSTHSPLLLETYGTQHITKHGSSWTCSMPFNIYPSILQEYRPMKTPPNAIGTSEPWNMIANITHMTGQQMYCRMLSHIRSGYMRVIRCRMSHVNVQTGRSPFIHCWLFACLLVCLLPSFYFLILLFSGFF
jgi:hypothetical protein